MNPFLRRRPEAPNVRALVQPARTADGAAVLRLYDPIDSWGGEWGISAKEFTKELDALVDVTHITLLINSPGGEVWEGLAILNALRAHPAKVTAVVEGIAASSASFIAAGVDELHIMQNAELFIHKAWGMAIGNSDDMDKMAADLLHTDANLASIYASKAGGDVDAWLAAMRSETFYSADEAVAAGLADKVLPASGGGASAARARFDLSALNSSHLPAARSAARKATGSSPDGSNPTREEPDMSDTLKAAICERLGIQAELDEDGVIAALDEALAEQADTPETEPEAPHVPEGTVIVDKAAFDELQARAVRGDEAERAAVAARRDQIIHNAKQEGRITPATETKFRALLDDNEEAAVELINALQPVANMTERGDAREQVETDPEAGLYAKWTGSTTKEN